MKMTTFFPRHTTLDRERTVVGSEGQSHFFSPQEFFIFSRFRLPPPTPLHFPPVSRNNPLFVPSGFFF